MAFHSEKIPVNGMEMHVVIEGTGPDVLLLHGFPDTHAIWREQIPVLVAAGYRVIAPDLRGFGLTEMSPRLRDYRVGNLLKDVVGLLDALGIERVRLVAHDWGAVIGWQFTIRYRERVERYAALSVGHLSCYTTAGFMQKLKAYYIVLIQLRGFAEWLFTSFDWWFFRWFAGAPHEYIHVRHAMSPPGRWSAGMSYYRANIALLIPRHHGFVNVPVMGIFSSADRFLVENQMVRSEAYCKAGWRYECLEGVGHWMTTEAPERVNPLLLDFLR